MNILSNPANYTVIRFSALPVSSPTLVAAAKAGAPQALRLERPRSGFDAPTYFFTATEDTRWVAPGQYAPYDRVLTPSSSDAFVMPDNEVGEVLAWLDGALPGWRDMVDNSGWPLVRIGRLDRDPIYNGATLAVRLQSQCGPF